MLARRRFHVPIISATFIRFLRKGGIMGKHNAGRLAWLRELFFEEAPHLLFSGETAAEDGGVNPDDPHAGGGFGEEGRAKLFLELRHPLLRNSSALARNNFVAHIMIAGDVEYRRG